MRHIFYLSVFLLAFEMYGQVDINHFQNILQSVSSGSAAYGSGFQGRYNVNSRVVGDVYLDSSFSQTKFKMKKGGVNLTTPSRYDLFNHEFEVKTTGGIRVFNGSMVEEFLYKKGNDSLHFVNAMNFALENAPVTGFVEILASGKINIVKQTTLNVLKPTYNASLDVGDKNSYVKKKQTLFLLKGNELIRIAGKKQLMDLMTSKKELMEGYLKSNDNKMKSETEMILAVKFFNTLN